MRIENDAAMDRHRGPGLCGFCKKKVRSRDPHHLFTRGAGRLDVSINLIGLCTTFAGGDNCHQESHSGNEPTHEQLLTMVAVRENCLQRDLEACIYILRWLPKQPTGRDVDAAFSRFEANNEVRAVVRRVLRESGY